MIFKLVNNAVGRLQLNLIQGMFIFIKSIHELDILYLLTGTYNMCFHYIGHRLQ
jgi:hypothetical protein